MPTRIEIDVPISTRPLPPVSSSGLSTDGRIEYFTGPNSVDCTPVANSATSSTTMFCVTKPTAGQRHDRDFHRGGDADQLRLLQLLGDLPGGGREQEVGQDEQRRREVRVQRALRPAVTPSQNSRPMMACRNTLSLNAPSACVRKNGRKRRWPQQLELVVRHAASPIRLGALAGLSPRAIARQPMSWRWNSPCHEIPRRPPRRRDAARRRRVSPSAHTHSTRPPRGHDVVAFQRACRRGRPCVSVDVGRVQPVDASPSARRARIVVAPPSPRRARGADPSRASTRVQAPSIAASTRSSRSRLQAHHHRLRFRIAEAHVELDHLRRAGRVDHQARRRGSR